MSEWKIPETEPNEDELRQNIPDLTTPYLYDEGYVYYVTYNIIHKARCNGKEATLLYRAKTEDCSGFKIKLMGIKEDYLYFNQTYTYTYQSSDPMFESKDADEDYRVKIDKSRALQYIGESVDYRGFGSDSFSPGSTHGYKTPVDMKNPLFKETEHFTMSELFNEQDLVRKFPELKDKWKPVIYYEGYVYFTTYEKWAGYDEWTFYEEWKTQRTKADGTGELEYFCSKQEKSDPDGDDEDNAPYFNCKYPDVLTAIENEYGKGILGYI